MVLWGTDNLKTEGGPIAQALALMGAAPRFDSYGRLAGAMLIPLDRLAHPRVDVVITLSGIFRDLLPLQIKLLAEAAFLAASADEPSERNFVRKHALAFVAEHGGDLETAALRVFGNADGAYGSNVNNLVESGAWDDEDELAETYTRRKGFAYGRAGAPMPAARSCSTACLQTRRSRLPEPRLGRTRRHHGRQLLRHARRHQPRGEARQRRSVAPVYIGDQTKRRGHGAHADRTGGAGNPHPHAQPEMVRGHAQARLRGRAPDRGPCHQHDGLVGDDRTGRALGLRADHPNLRARPGDARAARRASTRPPRPR